MDKKIPLRNRIFLPKKKYLKEYLEDFWFAPQDVLLRATEANIWERCKITHPLLDIGIGDGQTSKILLSKIGKIDVGIDIDAKGVEKAKRNKVYKKVICMNAERMAFKSNSFSSIISNSTFEHIRYDKKAIGEVSRILRINGHFFLTVPCNYFNLWLKEFIYEKNSQKVTRKVIMFNRRVAHLHYHTLNEWRNTFTLCGMKLVYHKYYFSKSTTKTFYNLMNFSTIKIKNRELWSWLGHSKFNKLIPKSLIKFLLTSLVLHDAYSKTFLTSDQEIGSMLFLIGKKE